MEDINIQDELDRVVFTLEFLEDACLAFFPRECTDLRRNTIEGMALTFQAAIDRLQKVQQFLADN